MSPIIICDVKARQPFSLSLDCFLIYQRCWFYLDSTSASLVHRSWFMVAFAIAPLAFLVGVGIGIIR